MARARNIKPGLFKNEDLAECSVWARFLFPGLWMLADREGRVEDRPKRIKGEIFPFDAIEVDPLLAELVQWGFVRRYVADGKRCIQINNFTVHQCPHSTEKDSDLPDESGVYTVNERAKNGCITGKTTLRQKKSIETTVVPPLNNSGTTVNKLSDNALNPESLITESLITESLITESGGEKTVVFEEPERIEQPPALKTGAICIVLKSEGIASVNPSHPGLIALIDAGAEVGHFADVAKSAAKSGKASFAYVLATVKGQLADAQTAAKAAISANGRAGQGPALTAPKNQSFATQDAVRGMLRWEQMTGQTHPDWHTVGGRPNQQTHADSPVVDMGDAIEVQGVNARIPA